MKLQLALCATLSCLGSVDLEPLMAQTHPSNAQRWLAETPAVPEFVAPATQKLWEKRRQEIRAELGRLLGQLPPRPQKPSVRILAREERNGYVLEKLQFDNGAGADVPGYLLLPADAAAPAAKSPAILYCHWHGGQYDIGKEELFGTNAVPEPPGPALARRGF